MNRAIYGFHPQGRGFMYNDGWGSKSWAGEDDNFVFRGGLAFPKWAACGNYRTPGEAPYAYGPHVINGPLEKFEGEGILCDYDDRLRQFDGEKWREAIASLEGERLKDASLSKLSAFLSQLYGKQVECLQVIEGCNVGNGYPYLIFVSRKLADAPPPSEDTPS